MTACYTQKDFENIINKGISYTIPMDILMTIRKLEEKVKQVTAASSATLSYRHTHHPPKINSNNNSTNNNSNSQSHSNPNENWKGAKPLSVTMAMKSNNPMNQIKLLLNKLSRPNYQKLKGEIMALLEEESVLTSEVAKEMLVFLSRTKEISMSELYTELFAVLEDTFPTIFCPVLTDFWTQYESNLLTKIPGVALDEENEEYSAMVKFTVELRAQTIFLAHWCRHHQCTEQGVAILQILFRQIEILFADLRGRNKNQVDEWTEHVFLWVKILGPGEIRQKVPDLWQQVESYGQINIKNVPNMTSRSKFKYQQVGEIYQ